jgi:hypothetical protein
MTRTWVGLIIVAGARAGGGGTGAARITPLTADFCEQQTFTDTAETPYVLPWTVGARYEIQQDRVAATGELLEMESYRAGS